MRYQLEITGCCVQGSKFSRIPGEYFGRDQELLLNCRTTLLASSLKNTDSG